MPPEGIGIAYLSPEEGQHHDIQAVGSTTPVRNRGDQGESRARALHGFPERQAVLENSTGLAGLHHSRGFRTWGSLL